MFLGSLYVNSFNAFGRHWQVTVQAEGEFRNRAEALSLFQVRNKNGQMVPLGTVAQLRENVGPISVSRYNLYKGASVTGNILTGYSSGDVIKEIDRITHDTLPLSMKADWTELIVPADSRRQHFDLCLLPGHCLRVSCLICPVRKLDLAPGGHSGGAVVPALFGGRRPLYQSRCQHLCANRPRGCWSAWRVRTLFLSSSMPSS